MRIPESFMMMEVNGHLFQDPYYMFSPSRSPRLFGPMASMGTQEWRQDKPSREYLIPIQVEGRDNSEFDSTPILVALTEERQCNSNNNGLHSNSRIRRRQQYLNESSTKKGENSTTSIPISHHPPQAVKDIISNTARTPPPISEGRPSNDVIDLCMFEDMSDSDGFYVDSTDDLPLAASSSSKLKSDDDRSRKHRPNTRKFDPTPNYPVYKYLKSQLALDGRQIDYIQGDGNCFFRALSKEIYETQDFHDDVRQAVVDLMEEYPKEFEQFLDSGIAVGDHVKDMREPSTWASSAEIYAAATLLQREIYVLSPNHSETAYSWMQFKPRFTYTKDTLYHPCFITLCHTHGNHYDRIAPNHGSCNCDLEPPFLSGVHAYINLMDKE